MGLCSTPDRHATRLAEHSKHNGLSGKPVRGLVLDAATMMQTVVWGDAKGDSVSVNVCCALPVKLLTGR